LIIFDRQCFKRKCQFQEIVFAKSFCETELNWRTLRLIDTSRKTSHASSQYRRSLRRLICSSKFSYTCFIQSLAF
jgi:hypothetical protein